MVNGIEIPRVEFKELDDIDNHYSSTYYDVKINKYCVKCGLSLRFWGEKGWINTIDSCGWVQWYFRYWLDRRSNDDDRQIVRWKGIVIGFQSRLVKVIKDVNDRFDDYTISPIIRQVSLHWGFELLESDLL